MNIMSNIYHGNRKYTGFSQPNVCENNNTNFVRMCKAEFPRAAQSRAV